VHEERERVGRRGRLRGRLRGRRGDGLVRRRLDDLDLPGLELGAQLGEILLVEVVLERERLQGGLVDRLVLLGLFEERRDRKFKRGAQFFLTSFAFVGVGRTRGRSPPTTTTASGAVVFRAGPKKFAEPVSLPSTSPTDLPLPRCAFR
jgi:hypothetical protein